jgi:minor extracellular serine protease Vpr
MRLRMIRSVAAIAAILGTLAPIHSGAVRPEAAPNAGEVRPVWLPLGVSRQPVNVVLQLAGDPVAVQQGNAGRKLERREKDQIKAQLKASQDALHANIQGMGGTVLAKYQASYNGIKVRVARDKLEQLASLPGVVGVRPLFPVRPNNVRGVPLIGAPAVWQSLGLHGEGVKVAIIDTGIDYTHANFGGPGTVASYTAAHAAEKAPADPRYFGPNAPRIKGGIDLVGDSYDADPDSATYQPIPHPDPNPLDCDGHGSHVAGTAAGSGVTADGKTYSGPYGASTISGNAWAIGPGVAPKADLYAIRVFGCNGSTDVTVDAIEWAVDNDMDVINMSLGSSFGTKDDPSAVASTNAAKAGVIVVASAGNAGASQYITGSPASAEGAISVAASDPTPSFPGATLELNIGGALLAVQNSNNAPFASGTNYSIAVLRTAYPAGPVALGCSQAEYAAYPGGVAALAGKLIVTVRGVCSRVARAIFAQQNGAAASAMIDTSTGYPPFEGPITGSIETGPFNVTIPFFGVRGLVGTATSDGARLSLAASAIANNALLPNPNFLGIASFSSRGPRSGDSSLKPQITAPGVSIVSTGSGSGNEAATISGTSMAAPHVAGVAALTRQAHPHWRVADINAAIVNTGDPAQVLAHRISRGGTGLVQAAKSTVAQVVARADDERFATALNFGLVEMSRDFVGTRTIKLRNHGTTAAAFNVTSGSPNGSPHAVSLSRSSVNIPARGSVEVDVTLTVPVASAGASNGAGLSFREVAGIVQFTPAGAGDNGGAALRVPYYLVPRALSDVSTKLGKLRGPNPSAVAKVTNRDGAIAGDADFYAWGLYDGKVPGRASNDVRAVGTQSFEWDATRRLLVFAVNTHDRWSNASTNEFDINVDVDGDGIADYVVVGVDQGAVQAGAFNGVMGAFVFSTRSGRGTINFLATAPTDSATALLPVLTSQLCLSGEPCLSAANPRITYSAVAFDLANGGVKAVDGSAKFNVWASAISQGGFATVAPQGSDTTTVVSVDRAEWKLTPAKGVMVVTLDNKSGRDEAQLIEVDFDRGDRGDRDDRDED